jgi:hypothetical protein
MTWKEIKKAVEEVGISDDEEISLIKCEFGEGDKTFHKVRLGKALKLAENPSPETEDAAGCAV